MWSVDKEAQPHVAVGNGKNFKRIGHKDINIFKFLLVEQPAFDEEMVPVGAERPASSSFVGKSNDIVRRVPKRFCSINH